MVRQGRGFPDLLAYKTTKHVLIRDPAMGILQMFILFAVLCYLVGWCILYEKAYMLRESVSGIIQTSLARGDLMDASAYPYCSSSSLEIQVGAKLPCITGPDAWVGSSTPSGSGGSSELFVMTRMTEGEVDKYVKNPDDYTLGISFAVQALGLYKTSQDSKYSKSLPELTTRLLGSDGKEVLSGGQSAITRNGRYDTFSLRQLLFAAGVSNLDASHEAVPVHSFRMQGMVLMLNIACNMDMSGSVSQCDYRANRLQGAEAKSSAVVDVRVDSPSKSLQERRGVRIVINVSGYMGKFDLNSLLLAVAVSLALLKVVSECLGFMMSWCLPNSDKYRMYLRDESVNFQSLRAKDADTQKAVQHKEHQRLKDRGQIRIDYEDQRRRSPPGSPQAVSPTGQGGPHPLASPRGSPGELPLASPREHPLVSPRAGFQPQGGSFAPSGDAVAPYGAPPGSPPGAAGAGLGPFMPPTSHSQAAASTGAVPGAAQGFGQATGTPAQPGYGAGAGQLGAPGQDWSRPLTPQSAQIERAPPQLSQPFAGSLSPRQQANYKRQ